MATFHDVENLTSELGSALVNIVAALGKFLYKVHQSDKIWEHKMGFHEQRYAEDCPYCQYIRDHFEDMENEQ